MEQRHIIGVGNLWKESLRSYGFYFKKIATLALPIATLLLVVTVLGQVNSLGLYSGVTSFFLQALFFVGGALLVVGMFFYPAALVVGVLHSHENQGQSTSYDQFLKNIYAKTAGKFGSFVWISILSGIISLAAYAIFILPGIFTEVMFCFSIFILFAEGKTGLRALAQSWNYVRGHWWACFGRILLAVVVFICASAIVQIIIAPLSLLIGRDLQLALLIGQLFQFFVLLPFLVIYIFAIYHSVKSAHQHELTEEAFEKSKQKFAWIAILGVVFGTAMLFFAAHITAELFASYRSHCSCRFHYAGSGGFMMPAMMPNQYQQNWSQTSQTGGSMMGGSW